MARILICEDDPVYRDVAQLALTRAGHDVVLAADGFAAYDSLEKQAFDLIVTDIIMPGQDGLELISGLRKVGTTTPILAITAGMADLKEPLLQAAMVLGAQDILEKPFRARDLEAKVTALLNGSSAMKAAS